MLVLILLAGPANRSAIASAETVATTLTRVPGQTYSVDTTWTRANSPYLIDGNVTIAAGATLTIEPGVIVKFTGNLRTLKIYGVLRAIGTPIDRIVFTSVQDDSTGSDDGGDGYSVGAPGQWNRIWLHGAGDQTLLDNVDIRFGGYGSSAANPTVDVGGSSAVMPTIEDSTITQSQTSGVRVSDGATLTLRRSSISDNRKHGAYVFQSRIVGDHIVATRNAVSGIYALIDSSYAGAASELSSSDLYANGSHGIDLLIYGDVPLAKWMFGHFNNIYGNGGDAGTQLRSQYASFADWTNNYWGVGLQSLGTKSKPCPVAPQPTHVAWSGDFIGNPPDGPISWIPFVERYDANRRPVYCASDLVVGIPEATSPFDNSG